MPGASFTVASGINAAGQIVGFFSDATGKFHVSTTFSLMPGPLGLASPQTRRTTSTRYSGSLQVAMDLIVWPGATLSGSQ